jgi:hypothetical protein
MKKIKMITNAAIIFAAVGSALAFKAKSNPNLLLCSTSGVCIQQTNTIYSSQINGSPVTHPNVYTGTVGSPCDTENCPRFVGKVYNTQ